MVIIIDYGMGNVGSVKNALEFLGEKALISSNPGDLEKASHIILPGVGSFGDGINNLKRSGLVEVLEKEVLKNKKPFLGICLGMQLLAEEGEEGGLHRGLGWIAGKVRHFKVDSKDFRIPHVGWNDIFPKENQELFKGISSQIFYFVHSYFLEPKDKSVVAAVCRYGEEFTAAIQKDNIFGTQFHPEKSQKSGLMLLKNFINYA